MTGVYSVRFLGVSLASSSASAVVPVGKVWVIRTVLATPQSQATPAQLDIFAPYPLTLVQWADSSETVQVTRNLDINLALVAGETIRATAFTSTWSVLVSGYELTA